MHHNLNGYYSIGGLGDLGKLIKVGDRYILARQQSFAPCPPNSIAQTTDDCFVQQDGESIDAFVARCCIPTAELPYGAIPNVVPVRPLVPPAAAVPVVVKEEGLLKKWWRKLFGG